MKSTYHLVVSVSFDFLKCLVFCWSWLLAKRKSNVLVGKSPSIAESKPNMGREHMHDATTHQTERVWTCFYKWERDLGFSNGGNNKITFLLFYKKGHVNDRRIILSFDYIQQERKRHIRFFFPSQKDVSLSASEKESPQWWRVRDWVSLGWRTL